MAGNEEFDVCYDDFEDKVNLGKDVDLFISVLKDKFKAKLPEGYSMLIDFVDRFQLNETLDILVRELVEKVKIGMLTNIYPRMLDEIRKRNLIPQVEWDAVIDSSVEKIKKPAREIYELAEERAGMKGSNILFVDNKQENLNVAKELSWQTFFYDSSDYAGSSKKLELFLKNRGVIN